MLVLLILSMHSLLHDSLPISSARTIAQPHLLTFVLSCPRCAVVLFYCLIFSLSGVQFRFLSLFVALWNSLKRAAQTLPGLARQVLRHKFMSDTPTTAQTECSGSGACVHGKWLKIGSSDICVQGLSNLAPCNAHKSKDFSIFMGEISSR